MMGKTDTIAVEEVLKGSGTLLDRIPRSKGDTQTQSCRSGPAEYVSEETSLARYWRIVTALITGLMFVCKGLITPRVCDR